MGTTNVRYGNILVAPAPEVAESNRITEQALRVRLLRGQQENDIEQEVQSDFSPEVAYDLSWRVDLSENSFKNVWQQLSIAYDHNPTVTVEDVDDLSPIITPDLWPQSQCRQLVQQAVNECFVRLDWPSSEDEVQEVKYRVVTPNMVYGCRAHRDNPDRPIYVCEIRVRTKEEDGESVEVYTYETWDITDEENPIFTIEEDQDGERVDVTSDYLGEELEYPYWDNGGRPILPYVLYHAKIQSQLWDFMAGVELVRGTLRLSSAYTWWFDAFKNASNPVRVAVDLDLPAGSGRAMSNGVPLQTVVYSPKTIIKMQSTMDRSGSIQTFPPGMDPLEGLESLRSYAERLAVYAGLNPGDLQAKGSTQSGIAIIVSRDGMRRAQQKSEPANRKGDQQLLSKAAKLANAYGGHGLPEEERSYRITYSLIGQSSFERKEQLENVQRELTLNLISPVGAVRKLFPDFQSDSDAIAYLLEIDEQNRALTDVRTVSSTLDATESQGAREIVESVAEGRIPSATGIEMLVNFFSISRGVADAIVGTIGTTGATTPSDTGE